MTLYRLDPLAPTDVPYAAFQQLIDDGVLVVIEPERDGDLMNTNPDSVDEMQEWVLAIKVGEYDD